MESISELKGAIVAYLEGNGALAEAKVLAEFPEGRRGFPLEKPVVAVGLSSVELDPGGFGGYLGEGAEASLYGRLAAITVRFELLCREGGGCHPLFEQLCDKLLLGENPFGFERMDCGDISWEKDAQAHKLTARGTLRAAVSAGDDSAAIGAFQLIRKE